MTFYILLGALVLVGGMLGEVVFRIAVRDHPLRRHPQQCPTVYNINSRDAEAAFQVAQRRKRDRP